MLAADKIIKHQACSGSLPRMMPPLPKLLQWFDDNPALFSVYVFVFLMLYQAALPSGLTLDPAARDIVWNIFPSATFHISKADVVGNVVPYFIFGHFLFVACWRRQMVPARVLVFTFLGTVAMAVSVETEQLFNPERGTAVWDVLSGALGGVLALGSGLLYVRTVSDRIAAWWSREIRCNPVIVAAALMTMAVCWDAARPFYVISSGTDLAANIKSSVVIPFEPPGRDIREQLNLRPASPTTGPVRYDLDYFGKIAERFLTYGVLCVLFTFGRRKGGVRAGLLLYLAVIVVVELLNLGVVGGHVDVTRVVLGLIAIPFALVGAERFLRQPEQGLRFLLVINVLYVLIGRLRPFQFGPLVHLTADNFIPLMFHVRSTDVMQLANIVESVVLFAPMGMILYLRTIRPEELSGRLRWPSARFSCLFCGGLGLLGECAQLWLPSRTATLEDVLYAALGGYVGAAAAQLYCYYTVLPVTGGTDALTC